jgi:hypothetical protein
MPSPALLSSGVPARLRNDLMRRLRRHVGKRHRAHMGYGSDGIFSNGVVYAYDGRAGFAGNADQESRL